MTGTTPKRLYTAEKNIITYRIRKSEDGNDIENFDIAINSRGFGDPPYEGPEYEKYINVENE